MLTDVHCTQCGEVVRLSIWPGNIQASLRCGCMSSGVNQQWSTYWRMAKSSKDERIKKFKCDHPTLGSVKDSVNVCCVECSKLWEWDDAANEYTEVRE